jgi:hypothetical protein
MGTLARSELQIKAPFSCCAPLLLLEKRSLAILLALSLFLSFYDGEV